MSGPELHEKDRTALLAQLLDVVRLAISAGGDDGPTDANAPKRRRVEGGGDGGKQRASSSQGNETLAALLEQLLLHCTKSPDMWAGYLAQTVSDLLALGINDEQQSNVCEDIFAIFNDCAARADQATLEAVLRTLVQKGPDVTPVARVFSFAPGLWSRAILESWTRAWADPGHALARRPSWEPLILEHLFECDHQPVESWFRSFFALHGPDLSYVLYMDSMPWSTVDVGETPQASTVSVIGTTSHLNTIVVTVFQCWATAVSARVDGGGSPLSLVKMSSLPDAGWLSSVRVNASIFPVPPQAAPEYERTLLWFCYVMERHWISLSSLFPILFHTFMRIARGNADATTLQLAGDACVAMLVLLENECSPVVSQLTPGSVGSTVAGASPAVSSCASSLPWLCYELTKEGNDELRNSLYRRVMTVVGVSSSKLVAGQILFHILLSGASKEHFEVFWSLYTTFCHRHGPEPFRHATSMWAQRFSTMSAENRRKSLYFCEKIAESLCQYHSDSPRHPHQTELDALFSVWSIILASPMFMPYPALNTHSNQHTRAFTPSAQLQDEGEMDALVVRFVALLDKCIPYVSESHPSLPALVDWGLTFMWSQLDSSSVGRDHVTTETPAAARQRLGRLELGKQLLVTLTKSHMSMRSQLIDTLMDLVFTPSASDYVIREPTTVLPANSLAPPLATYIHPHRTSATFEDNKRSQQNDRLFQDQHLRSRIGPVTHRDQYTHRLRSAGAVIRSNIGHLQDLFQRLVYPCK